MKSKHRSPSRRSKSPRRARLPSSIFAPTAVDARFVIEPILIDLLADAREVCKLDDPLRAELFGAQLRITLCDVWRLLMDDPERVMGRTLVKLVERRTRPDALALLSAVGATWPEPAARQAQAAVLRLIQRGVDKPSWIDAVSGLRFVAAKLGEGSHAGVQLLLTCFEHPRLRYHCFCTAFDSNMGGIVKDVFVTEQVDEVFPTRSRHRRFPGLTFRPIEEAAATAMIATGLELRRSVSPEVSDLLGLDQDDQVVLNLLEARLRVLPPVAKLEVDVRPAG